MNKETAMSGAEVSRDEALAVIGKVWAGNAGDDLWRAFNAGDYAKARDIAARKVAAQGEELGSN